MFQHLYAFFTSGCWSKFAQINVWLKGEEKNERCQEPACLEEHVDHHDATMVLMMILDLMMVALIIKSKKQLTICPNTLAGRLTNRRGRYGGQV